MSSCASNGGTERSTQRQTPRHATPHHAVSTLLRLWPALRRTWRCSEHAPRRRAHAQQDLGITVCRPPLRRSGQRRAAQGSKVLIPFPPSSELNIAAVDTSRALNPIDSYTRDLSISHPFSIPALKQEENYERLLVKHYLAHMEKGVK